jgi:alpha-galactosidase
VAEGYREAGYQYVALDDCWQAPHRVDGHIVSHPQRFPSGIKALGEPHSPAALCSLRVLCVGRIGLQG